MLVWWASFPLLVLGLWYALRHRLRQVSPIVIFTTMLTLAYSVFQGNVGTAYRQRSQLLVFYFIFVAVGAILVKERQEDKRRQQQLAKQELAELQAARVAARRQGMHPQT
jgi:putative Ca2+/H+ antiporter (TMEM165/GDT1 family)